MTVGGPIDAAALGVTDAHDHLFLRSPLMAGEEIDDPDLVLDEIRDGVASGLQTIVELTPIGLGRRPDLLRRVSNEAGIQIVGATGYHRDAHYATDHWVMTADEDLLLERMLADIMQGMHPTDWADPAVAPDPARAGVIKAGASYQTISVAEHRRLSTAAEAARRTGLAVVVHTEAGTCGPAIADALLEGGVQPGRIILAHMDRDPDPVRHLDLLERGLFLVYDTIGRTQYHPDSIRIELIAAVCAAGRGGQILLGLDLGKRGYFRADGGHGLRHLMSGFVPRLRERVGPEMARAMLVDNAARAFAITASSAA
jgi:phosphotriesterase-related protein